MGQKEVEEFLSEDIEESLQEEKKDEEEAWNFDRLFVLQLVTNFCASEFAKLNSRMFSCCIN